MALGAWNNQPRALREVIYGLRDVLDEIEELERLLRQSSHPGERRHLTNEIKRLEKQANWCQHSMVKHQLRPHLREYAEFAASESFQGRTLVSTYRGRSNGYGLHVAFLGSIYEGLAKNTWSQTWQAARKQMGDDLISANLDNVPRTRRTLVDNFSVYALLEFLPNELPLRQIFEAVPRIAQTARTLSASDNDWTQAAEWPSDILLQVHDYCARRAANLRRSALRAALQA